MSASVGRGFFESSAAAAMSCPDWQYPHWGTSPAIQAFWSGWSPFADSPSMVVIRCPAASLTGSWQDRTGSPSSSTVHAPHCDRPQPNLVPVSPSASRRTQRSGVSVATSTVSLRPFTRRVKRAMVHHLPVRPESWTGTEVAASRSPARDGRMSPGVAMIADLPELRDRVGVFQDRGHAGQVLARMLEGKLPPGAKLLAIPAGGVPVGAAVAHALRLPLDVAVVSKITPS